MASLEGEPTKLEKKVGLDIKVGASGVLKSDIGEDDILNLAKAFVGFDIENDDVEILGVYFYLKTQREIKERELKGIDVPDDILKKVHKNLYYQQVEKIPLLLVKKQTTDSLYALSYSENRKEEDFVVFSEIIPNYKDKDMFRRLIYNCLDTWSKCDFNESIEVDGAFDRTKVSFQTGKKANAVFIIVNNNRLNILSITPTKRKGKQLNKTQMIFGTRIIKSFTPKDIDKLYKICLRKLK
jgi:hypothetical protein